ncbi:hypothetical protein C0585_00725 [Candidatus Woesearchaeota archaeon]|nr:MAG: hypothetical protein C0585_00725 [Candidatus Woesearchaeota archaeon]
MKLTRFNELWTVVNTLEIDSISKTEIKKYFSEGIETDLSDIFTTNNNELLTILKDGSLRKTIVYISEIAPFKERIILPKYHIINCQTLKKMKRNHRLHRYKKTLRDDGKFYMIIDNFGDIEKGFKKLAICKNCLKEYNLNYNKNFSVENFDLVKFKNNSLFSELETIDFQDDLQSIPRIYSDNWGLISDTMKKIKNYTCEKCGIDLTNDTKFLNTHHIFGDITDNSYSNLKVLCVKCHSEEFNHSHIKDKTVYKEFIKKYS